MNTLKKISAVLLMGIATNSFAFDISKPISEANKPAVGLKFDKHSNKFIEENALNVNINELLLKPSSFFRKENDAKLVINDEEGNKLSLIKTNKKEIIVSGDKLYADWEVIRVFLLGSTKFNRTEYLTFLRNWVNVNPVELETFLSEVLLIKNKREKTESLINWDKSEELIKVVTKETNTPVAKKGIKNLSKVFLMDKVAAKNWFTNISIQRGFPLRNYILWTRDMGLVFGEVFISLNGKIKNDGTIIKAIPGNLTQGLQDTLFIGRLENGFINRVYLPTKRILVNEQKNPEPDLDALSLVANYLNRAGIKDSYSAILNKEGVASIKKSNYIEIR